MARSSHRDLVPGANNKRASIPRLCRNINNGVMPSDTSNGHENGHSEHPRRLAAPDENGKMRQDWRQTRQLPRSVLQLEN